MLAHTASIDEATLHIVKAASGVMEQLMAHVSTEEIAALAHEDEELDDTLDHLWKCPQGAPPVSGTACEPMNNLGPVGLIVLLAMIALAIPVIYIVGRSVLRSRSGPWPGCSGTLPRDGGGGVGRSGPGPSAALGGRWRCGFTPS